MDAFDVLKNTYNGVVRDKFKIEQELTGAETTFKEVKTIVALVMVYNCMYHKMARMQSNEEPR